MTTNFVFGILIAAIVSYLLGSLNSPIIVCKTLKGVDIRTIGSKNAGMTNTFRCCGIFAGILTIIGDLGKGVIAVLLCKTAFTWLNIGIEPMLTNIAAENETLNIATGGSTVFLGYIAGFFAIIGHIFPIYYGFKGGKGILTSSSILLVVDIRTFAIIIPFFLIVSFATRYISVGSISAAIFYPFLTFLVQYFWRGFTISYALLDTVLVIFTSALLIYMHKGNIKRLKEGTEHKIKIKNLH